LTQIYFNTVPGTYSSNPILFVQFDQTVDTSPLVKSIQFSVDGKNKAYCAAREASKAEILSDSIVTQLTAEAGESRWIAVAPVKELTKNTRFAAKISVLATEEYPDGGTIVFSTAEGLSVNSK
jgi:hypothetical protein